MPADAVEVLDTYMNDMWNKLGDANAAYCLALQRRRREEQVEPDNDMAEHYLDLAAQKRMTPSAYVAMRRWSEQATARGQQWPYGCSPEIEPDTRETMPRTSFPYVPQEFYDDAIVGVAVVGLVFGEIVASALLEAEASVLRP